MKQLTQSEIISISTLIGQEANGIAVAKAAINAISDEQLRNMVQSAITAAESRIRGLQQIIHEHNISTGRSM